MTENGNGLAAHYTPDLVEAVAEAVARKVDERRKINAIARAVLQQLREYDAPPAALNGEAGIDAPAGAEVSPLRSDYPLVFGSPPEAAVCSPSTYTRNLVRALNRRGYVVRLAPEYARLEDAAEYRRLLASTQELREGCVVELGQVPTTGERRVVLELVDMFRAHRNTAGYLQRADLTLTISDYSLREVRRVGVDALRSDYFPLGVDTRLYHPGAVPWNWREHVTWSSGPVPEEAFVVLAHGFWQERKGLRFALEAYRRAFGTASGRRSGTNGGPQRPAVLLIKSVPRLWGQSVRDLVAAGAEGGPLVALTEAELSDRDMPSLYAAADVVLHLHRMEAFGFIPLEAMACGKPVVLTDYSGVQEYADATCTVLVTPRKVSPLPHENTPEDPVEPTVAEAARGGGYHWAVPDVRKAADALQRLHRDEALRAELGRAARVRAKEFTWDRAAEELVSRCDAHGIPIRRKPAVTRTPGMVSVCIPVYNSLPDLQRLLRSLLARTDYPQLEVVVSDDGSAEHVWEWLQRFQQQELGGKYALRYQRSAERRGIPHSRSRGWWAARGEYICSVDCDVEAVDADWLHQLVAGYREGIVGGKLLTPDGRLQHAGVFLDPNGMPALHHSYRETDAGQRDRREEVVAVTGALQFFHGSLLEEIGGLHPGYGDYGYEDIDWCLEARRLGYPVIYDPAVRLVHHEGSYRRAGGTYDLDAAYRYFMQRWPPQVILDLSPRPAAGTRA